MVRTNQKAPRGPTGGGRHAATIIGLLTCAVLLGACGGGGGGNGGSSGGTGGGSGWSPGVFMPSSSFAAQCEDPRSGIDPETGQPYADVQGTVLDENNFLRSYSDETYLWYAEIVDQDPANFNDPLAYFDELKTNDTTPSGAPKDKFHFTVPTDEWVQLSQSGVSAGYGAAWVILEASPPNREVVVAYTEPGSPATAPGVDLARGARILAVDGAQVSDGPADALNAGLFPAGPGEAHTFTVEDLNSGGNTREIQMTSENVTSTPVQNVGIVASGMGNVGYLLFNDHIATAETGLIDAIEQLAGVNEVVLDIRYNGGGFLAIASQLAYMIAGDVPTAGQTFEEMQFNDKHPSTNPITGQPLQPMPFFDETLDFSEPPGQPLPTLDLPRVFVLTGPNTCSASESIMNGLAGVDVEVIQVGSTTCGKPYGFYPTDNCGTTYFTIQFRGANAKNFGDYADGFMPAEGGGGTPAELPGCLVADDFEHSLGDPLEARFQAALALIEGQGCPPGTVVATEGAAKARAPLSAVDGIMPKSPWRENRILRRDR